MLGLGYALLLAPPGLPRIMAFAAAATMALVALGHAAVGWIAGLTRFSAGRAVVGLIARDAMPGFVTDADGVIEMRNAAAVTRFGDDASETLAGTLRGLCAEPAAIILRLQSRARRDGAAHEDFLSRRDHVRLHVHRIGHGRLLWRIEQIADRPGEPGADLLSIPMITVGRAGAVLYMNDAARALAGRRVKSLDRLFADGEVTPGGVMRLSAADGTVPVIVHEPEPGRGRRELFILPVAEDLAAGAGPDFETLPVPMLRIEASGRILKANDLAKTLLGVEIGPDTGIGQVMQGLGRPVCDWLKDTAEGRKQQQSEFLRLTRRDREVFVQVTLSRVADGNGAEVIAVLNDATELKTLEAQFVQSQKMQAIGQLAGGVAHDFNNLLTAISGHCDLLLLRHDQGDQDYGDLVQINQNANRAAALVGQLLAFSRKQTLRPEMLDLRETLSDLTHLLNRLVGERITLSLSHDPVLRPIRADKRQLEQVLLNLVVNARDAMPDGGEIRVSTEAVRLDDPLDRDRAQVPPGDYVCVRVSDDGVGIAPDKLQKVFEPFYTTKRVGEGTGLGLSTAYGIIKQTGGYIFVDSVVGRGTEFTLYIPVFDGEPDAEVTAPAPAAPAISPHGEGVVLLVEDEAPVRAFASRALRLRGYTVIEAESAEDALRTLEDPELDVDVFVTDVVMPGMDGPSWVREALKTRPDVRVVFVSGYAEGAFGDTQPAVPNSVFLPKPFSLNQLTDTVHQQLH
ncbi:ATP-binding response regulator [Pukyongiella litopenaei]|uniref:histidine kinase n=1 Tax=Pukyongiella litopenaei TaxID=2605946 RepID=A0A2S0MW02_9RHOB|nr:ATP-binding protein [Pukyongiella litopenaei]AVO39863.1 response regulator [Pukyongiella litopenaei]